MLGAMAKWRSSAVRGHFEGVVRTLSEQSPRTSTAKSSLSIHHDTCKYLHPNLDPFETCTIHDNTSAF